MAKEVLGNSKNVRMVQIMAIVTLKIGNLGLEVKSLNTILITMEEEKKGLLKQIKGMRNTNNICKFGIKKRRRWRRKSM